MASIFRRRRGGKLRFYVQWFDPFKGEGRAGLRWVSCSKEGATNAEARKALLAHYQAKEDARRLRAVGTDGTTRSGVTVRELVEQYELELDDLAEIRARQGGRAGLAQGTVDNYKITLATLVEQLGAIQTLNLTAEHIRALKRHWQKHKTPATVNRNLRSLRAFLNRYGDSDPPFFSDTPDRLFKRALSAVAVDRKLPETIKPAQLRTMLECAREFEDGALFRIVALLMLVGGRQGELMALKWADVDPVLLPIILTAERPGNPGVTRPPFHVASEPRKGENDVRRVPLPRAA